MKRQDNLAEVVDHNTKRTKFTCYEELEAILQRHHSQGEEYMI